MTFFQTVILHGTPPDLLGENVEQYDENHFKNGKSRAKLHESL